MADRFHVMRLINQAFTKTFKELDERVKRSKGLERLLIKHSWRLDSDQKLRLDRYLEKIPSIRPIYEFKQEICQLMSLKSINHYQSKQSIRQLLFLISQLQAAHFDDLVRLGHTMHRWDKEIACMWRYTKNNSITEGFHRVFKLIQRRAFGFKNFENYRLRVIASCA